MDSQVDRTRPIIGIESRTAQEVFDIMCDRIRSASLALPKVESETIERQIDAGAKFLRETHGAGKRLTPWPDTPKATKKKWLALSEGVLRASGTLNTGGTHE